MIRKILKRIFCKHEYVGNKLARLPRSNRVGNDNHVISINEYKCKHCSKSLTVEILDRVEKDFYKE